MSRFLELTEGLKHYINVFIELYSKKVLRARSYSVGKGVSFNIRWNHIIIPPIITGDGDIRIGNDVVFWGKVSFFSSKRVNEKCEIEIGDETEIGDDVVFRACQGIRVGKKCQIASGVRIFDFNGHALSPVLRNLGWQNGGTTPPEEIRPVYIEDNVWIGERAFIHPGVTIGRNSIVAAGSNVTRDVPPNVIVAGTPARVSYWLNKKQEKDKEVEVNISRMSMLETSS